MVAIPERPVEVFFFRNRVNGAQLGRGAVPPPIEQFKTLAYLYLVDLAWGRGRPPDVELVDADHNRFFFFFFFPSYQFSIINTKFE